MTDPNDSAIELRALRKEVETLESVQLLAAAMGAFALVLGGGIGIYLAAKTQVISERRNFSLGRFHEHTSLAVGIAMIVLSLALAGLAACVVVGVRLHTAPRRSRLRAMDGAIAQRLRETGL